MSVAILNNKYFMVLRPRIYEACFQRQMWSTYIVFILRNTVGTRFLNATALFSRIRA
jgi:hypothetical protein